MHSIWVTFAPVAIINFALLIHMVIFAATRDRWPIPEDLKARHSSKFLGFFSKHWWFWVTTPIVRALITLRFSPNIITFIGCAISCVAAYLFVIGMFGYAGWTMILGATFDMFDGKVARITGKVTRSGAYYDSVMDRFGESALMLGLAIHFRYSWVLFFVILGLVGSTLVSYTRARGEGVGVICTKGTMQRPERAVYLGVASIFQPTADLFFGSTPFPPPPVLVIAAILIIAVMTMITAIYRMVYIMNQLDTEDKRVGRESIPQVLMRLSTPEGRLEWFEKMKQRHGLK